MTSRISSGNEVGKDREESQASRFKDSSAGRQADTFKRWQTAYKLAETYALLNQSKPSFEAQFKVDQARELFLSLSEDYVVLGITKDRFPGTPVIPHSVQQRLDAFGQTLKGYIKTDPDDPPKRRRVLDILLDTKQTDPVVGIKLPEDLYEKCQNLGLSAQGAISLIKQFQSLREDVVALLSPDRNQLKGLVSDLWDQLAEGASAETLHAQERADKRAKLLHLDDDLYGEPVEISSCASSDEIVYREQGDGSSWHTVDSSSEISNPYFKASPVGSVSRLESLRFDPEDPGPVEHQALEKPQTKQPVLAKLWGKKLYQLEKDFIALEENFPTEQIKAWRHAAADADTELSRVAAEPPRLKRVASEISDEPPEGDQKKPSLKRPKMGGRDDRSRTAGRE
ncbi:MULTISPECIES: hypothetical protein [unclassified Neorhizobium]|uniref:hypothetical protein n=1 Tax=unclassified Neorhizobium TaxID=2629175 RepID=UPI001FF0E7E3|nr:MULTISPECIES: hypothetical protein [unclassified Neorhizobium]MCJ9673287.1 hypothetical protein [Neorhizobium sp. SHOUNA12B]MCJ9748671.1 hypothetical protein [Neorhizobium sp. SHOUNA12A]